MANSITITPYALRIRDTTTGDNLRLDALPNNLTLIGLMSDYLTMRTGAKSVDNDSRHALKALSLNSRHHHEIDGIIQGGSFGFEAEIENLDTGDIFTRTPQDCEYLPFYFSLNTATGQDEAILMLQRFGVFGVKSILETDFRSYVAGRIPDARVSINPIITDEYLEQVIGGTVKSITCVRFNVPNDVANSLGLDDHDEENATMETTVKAKRDHFLGIPRWMRDIAHDWSAHGRVIEISGIEYNDVKLHIDVGGKTKSVRLSDLKKVRMSLDVTGSVTMGGDGHPTLSSMRQAVEELLSSIRRAMGWDA